MIIRASQMRAFDEAAIRAFDDQMIAHARQVFPRHCAFLGAEQLALRVRSARERAAGCGFQSMNGIRLFLELIFLLGNSFDSDPQLPWAAEILADDADEGGRVDRLHRSASQHLDAVSGPNNELIDEVLARARQERVGSSREETSEDAIRGRLQALYPEKSLLVEPDALRLLIHLGTGRAAGYGLAGGGVALYIGLMFLLGSGFDTDPQFGFALQVLTDPAISDPNEKAQRLHAAAIDHLNRWCSRE